jgi:hypothetical protein
LGEARRACADVVVDSTATAVSGDVLRRFAADGSISTPLFAHAQVHSLRQVPIQLSQVLIAARPAVSPSTLVHNNS